MKCNTSYRRFFLLIIIFNYCTTTFSQSTIPEFRTLLEKASSPKAKADICFEIADRYSFILKVDSAIYYANKIKEYSELANYETGIGKYHLVYATSIFFRNRNDESIENAKKAIDILLRQKEYVLAGRAYIVLGSNQNVTDKISFARKNYWTAVALFKSADNTKGLYSVYRWLAYSYFKTSEIDSASSYQIKGLAAAERMKDAEKIYQSACWVGSTFLSLGEWQKAISYFDYGFKNITSTSDKVGRRSLLTDFATCLIYAHQFTRADSVIKEVESLNTTLKDAYGMAMLNQIKGTVEFERKNYPKAVFYLQQSADKMAELKADNKDMKDIVLLLGKASYEAHNYDSAIQQLQFVTRMARRVSDQFAEQAANLLISKSFQQKGMADSALFYFKNYSILKDSLLLQQKQKNVIEVTARYETEKKEQAIKILEKEQEANSYLIQLKNQQIIKQQLEADKKSQQLALISQQNEINKLDAAQKSLSLDNARKENEQRSAKERLMEKEVAYQKLLLAKQNQQKRIIYGGIGVILVLSGYTLFRYLRKKRLQNQKEVLNERLRISRELHDEVGATLSGVALFSEIAKQKMEQQQPDDAQLYLNHISANSKEMVEKMSDIVWAINPDNDSFERIMAKLQTYAFNLCAGKGITLRVDMDDNIRADYPAMQVKRNLYLFMKEAVNNAIKYSGAQHIYLSLKKREDMITAEIRDDGKGFDAGMDYTGNGLKNMRARAESIEALYIIDSQKGRGTSVRMQFHFHPVGGQAATI